MKIIFSFFFAVVFVCAAWVSFPFFVLAFEIPEVYIVQFDIPKANYIPGEEIKGSIFLKNRESFWISDLNFRFELYLEQENAKPLLIDRSDHNHFCLEPLEEARESFNYWLPDNLPAGRYFLRCSLVNSKGWEINFADRQIKIFGNGKILIASLIKVSGWSVDDNVNPSLINPGDNLKIDLKIANPYAIYATSTLVVSLDARTFDQFGNLAGKAELEQKITKKNILDLKTELTLPVIDNPGQYRTEIKFVNKGNGEIFSNLIDLAWIVKRAQGNAEIAYAVVNRDYFVPNQENLLKIKFILFGPLEKNDKIAISAAFQDNDGNIIAAGSAEPDYRKNEVELKIAPEKEIDNPRVLVELSKNGEILDSYEFKPRLKPPKRKEGNIPENENFFDSANSFPVLSVILTGSMSAVSILALYFLLRKKAEVFAQLNLKLKKISKKTKKFKR